MSANVSAISQPMPVTGISQGSAFAPVAGGSDAPTGLAEVFASLLGNAGQQGGAEAGETVQAPGLTLSNAFGTSSSTTSSSHAALSAHLPALAVEADIVAPAPREAPASILAAVARLLGVAPAPVEAADQAPEISLAEPTLAQVEPLADDASAPDPAALLAGLLQALTLLQDRLKQGEPAEPALVQSIEDTLAALAQAMGMPEGDLAGALAPKPTAALPAPVIAPPLPTAPGQMPMMQLVPMDAMPPEMDAAAPAAAAKPATDLSALTEKLADMARALAPADPALAGKLRALSQNLEAAAPDIMAKLGFDAELKLANTDADAALDTLLAVRTPERSAAPAPVIAAPRLDLPESLTLADRSGSEPKGEPVKTEPAKQTAPEPKTELAPRPVEATRTEPTRARAETAPQAPAAAAPEARPDQPSSTAAAGIAPLRADGIAAGARAVQAAYQTPHTQVNIPQMAYEIVRHASEGHNRFQIRLDPAELGRIDVRMDIDTKGTLNARLTVERAETLDLLQRDQRALEKALAQAGLDSSKTNLEFSLRQNPFARQDNGQGSGRDSGPAFSGDTASGAEEPAATVPATLYRGAATASGVNLFV